MEEEVSGIGYKHYATAEPWQGQLWWSGMNLTMRVVKNSGEEYPHDSHQKQSWIHNSNSLDADESGLAINQNDKGECNEVDTESYFVKDLVFLVKD